MMKDYLEEMEYVLNPMKKIYDEMNPMKNIITLPPDGVNVYNSLSSFSYLSAINKIQKEMVHNLYPMEKIYNEMSSMKSVMNSLKSFNITDNLYSYTTFLSSFAEFQKKTELGLNPFKRLQEEMDSISNPLKMTLDKINLDAINQFNLLEKSINPSTIEVLNSLNNLGMSKLDQLNEILKSLNISSVTVQETIHNELDEQLNSLTKEDKKILDEIFDSIKHIFPDINYLSESLSKGKYIAIIMYIFFIAIPTIYSFYENYFKHSFYKINRNNVRVRTEPSTNSDSMIIIKFIIPQEI